MQQVLVPACNPLRTDEARKLRLLPIPTVMKRVNQEAQISSRTRPSAGRFTLSSSRRGIICPRIRTLKFCDGPWEEIPFDGAMKLILKSWCTQQWIFLAPISRNRRIGAQCWCPQIWSFGWKLWNFWVWHLGNNLECRDIVDIPPDTKFLRSRFRRPSLRFSCVLLWHWQVWRIQILGFACDIGLCQRRREERCTWNKSQVEKKYL